MSGPVASELESFNEKYASKFEKGHLELPPER